MDLSFKTKQAVDLSQEFEGKVPYANITGNFDGMGLSCGALGKTFSNGEQQGLVKTFLSRHGSDALTDLMPKKGKEYIKLCKASVSSALPKIIRWSVSPKSGNVKQPYKAELEAFWTSVEMVSIQLEHAENGEGADSQKAIDAWGGENNLHEFFVFFDIMTQHGSLKKVSRKSVDDFVSLKGGLDQACEAITKECISVPSSVNHATDTRRNGHLWADLYPQSTDSAKQLFVMGYLRAKKSNSEWVYVALNRRGTFGLGKGYVNGTLYDITDKIGADTVAPLFSVDINPSPEENDPAEAETPAGGLLIATPASLGTFLVSAASLNFRSEPEIKPSNRIGLLHQGQIVTKLEETGTKWWLISADLAGKTLMGYVSSNHLVPEEEYISHDVGAITAVHLRASSSVSRKRDGGRVFHLNESDLVYRTSVNPPTREKQVNEIIDYLNPGRSSHKRYLAGAGKTFCNIYAYDFCCLCQVFLPRNWWTDKSISKLAQGIAVEPKYASTVRELRANDLHDWFIDWGKQFGWSRTDSATELQEAANEGHVSIIVAKRKDVGRSGHIVAVAPESSKWKANRHGAEVFIPVLSQAGSKNFTREVQSKRFWLGSQFQSFGFWINRGG